MQIQFDIKPFDTLAHAIDGLEVAFGFPNTLKIKCGQFSSMEREHLVKILTACKSFLTIEQKFSEFIKYYHIDCISKLLWDNTTWKVEVKDFRSKVKVYSGAPLGALYNDYTTKHDENPRVSSIMISQLRSMLVEARTVWGMDNFNWMYNREVRLISARNNFNRYAPGNDYYDIYSGRNN